MYVQMDGTSGKPSARANCVPFSDKGAGPSFAQNAAGRCIRQTFRGKKDTRYSFVWKEASANKNWQTAGYDSLTVARVVTVRGSRKVHYKLGDRVLSIQHGYQYFTCYCYLLKSVHTLLGVKLKVHRVRQKNQNAGGGGEERRCNFFACRACRMWQA